MRSDGCGGRQDEDVCEDVCCGNESGGPFGYVSRYDRAAGVVGLFGINENFGCGVVEDSSDDMEMGCCWSPVNASDIDGKDIR